MANAVVRRYAENYGQRRHRLSGHHSVRSATIPLDTFAAQDKLTIELQTDAVTRYPNDPREFGVAIKQLRLGK